MALAEAEVAPKRLTYEGYRAEGEINRRYDIIDGVRIFMPNLTPLHQIILFNIAMKLNDYQRRSNRGWMFVAPRDVLVDGDTLRTCQPDVMFITNERIAGQSFSDSAPFPQAPEIVVEILSDSDTRSVRMAKIGDYCTVGAEECWLVSTGGETVEVLRLTPDGPERAALYGAGQTLQSLTFPDLTLALDDIFRIED